VLDSGSQLPALVARGKPALRIRTDLTSALRRFRAGADKVPTAGRCAAFGGALVYFVNYCERDIQTHISHRDHFMGRTPAAGLRPLFLQVVVNAKIALCYNNQQEDLFCVWIFHF